MPRYSIQALIAADSHIGEVEAESAEAAISQAYEDLDTSGPNVCHQCSREFNVGDIYALIASNIEDDDDTLEENSPNDKIAKLREQVKNLGHEPCA